MFKKHDAKGAIKRTNISLAINMPLWSIFKQILLNSMVVQKMKN